MDQLEKRIRDLREEIQDDEPHMGHFDRFEMKLKKTGRQTVSKWIGPIVSVAAVILIGLFIFIDNGEDPQSLTLADLSPDYAEAEYFYTSSIEQQTNRLYKLTNQMGGDSTIQMLMTEIKAYDKIYDQLCSDLNATPNDERVINAMITYYQTKLEIINKILFELENKQKNIKQYENIEI